ncbi:MAG TPA: hypothetical protein VL970_05350 [Candidatus Acidoferrales bacterium]|nr:hypothetical protein [Candidatus Acidoferrales bacterium]
MHFPTQAWILLSALLVAAGWLLSACHQLTPAGYAVFLLLAMPAIFFWGKSAWPGAAARRRAIHKLRRRFQRPAPGLFLLLALLSLFSGSLYPALNWDTNAYRLPRVLHWLGNGQWHWIHTGDARMNIAGCNFEWLAAPLILLSHSDRLLFLINWVPYLLLPGLIFGVLTGCQVRSRVAWWWMWFLSAGWCFAFQASSAANDSFGTVFALAAIDFALRAGSERKITHLWWSLLAIALATGVKQTNLPLVLVWLVAAWPCRALVAANKLRTFAVSGAALLVSVLPVSFLNWANCGSWLPVESPGLTNIGRFHLDPFWGIIGNVFCLTVQNLVPPLYHWFPPYYGALVLEWNDNLAKFVQTPFGSHFASFEAFGGLSAVHEHGVSEANAGVGLAVCLLLAVSIGGAFILRPKEAGSPPGIFLRLVRAAPWLALIVFMAKVGSYENARLLAPFYPLLFPAILAGASHGTLVRRRLWQRFGLATMVLTAFLVITLPLRPLFPAQLVFHLLHQRFPKNEVIFLEGVEYEAGVRWDIETRRACLRQTVPPEAAVVGYFPRLNNSDEPGLWLPYGRHRVELILPEDPPARLRTRGVRCLVAHSAALRAAGESVEQWLQRYKATLICQFTEYGKFISGSPPPGFAGYYVARVN